MKRILTAAVAGFAALAALAGPAAAQAPEKTKLELGVGGKPLLYYLPLTIAERKGFFKEQGLDVTINDFGGGAKSLQALVGGSVDAVTGAYEHTIRMQQKNQDVVAVLELGRFPGIVIGVAKDKADKVKTAADLKGLKLGVTAPGSSTHLTALYLLAKAGVPADSVPIIGVGGGASAVAALERGNVDAISHLDPVISKLEADGALKVIVDTRTEEGTKAVYGTTNPAATLYLKADFIKANPNTTQALTNALYKALKWIETASPEDIAAAVPEEYWLGDKALYIASVKANKATYSKTGIITEEASKGMLEFLKVVEPSFKDAPIDLKKTFDPTFVTKAAATVK
ncbi:ABC transporter substrate-binding protein [Methyloraptor flagellatus]|uniref:ABC transporter substrate-binding protein n=1 Tax=Methyloraptor flagellatus TaxID=3162530 RepID=A0AAU7X619_9HYPH